jgi:hypothetical protein
MAELWREYNTILSKFALPDHSGCGQNCLIPMAGSFDP